MARGRPDFDQQLVAAENEPERVGALGAAHPMREIQRAGEGKWLHRAEYNCALR